MMVVAGDGHRVAMDEGGRVLLLLQSSSFVEQFVRGRKVADPADLARERDFGNLAGVSMNLFREPTPGERTNGNLRIEILCKVDVPISVQTSEKN